MSASTRLLSEFAKNMEREYEREGHDVITAGSPPSDASIARGGPCRCPRDAYVYARVYGHDQ